MREITQAVSAAQIATTQQLSMRVYKIFRPEDWASFQQDGRFPGSADDRRDGFIHLCAWSQLAGTLARHFSRADDREVVVAALQAGTLAPSLRWERSRGGEAFPHLYAELLATHVAGEWRFERSVQGTYALPSEEPA